MLDNQEKHNNEVNYSSYELRPKKTLKHEIFCALCGMERNIWVSSGHLTSMQHIQVVLASVFLAWALHSTIGTASFFLYPFVWMFADIGKKVLFRRGAKCGHCGFDAITYKKDVRKAKDLIKNHLEAMPKKVIFKRGYRKHEDSKDLTHYFNP